MCNNKDTVVAEACKLIRFVQWFKLTAVVAEEEAVLVASPLKSPCAVRFRFRFNPSLNPAALPPSRPSVAQLRNLFSVALLRLLNVARHRRPSGACGLLGANASNCHARRVVEEGPFNLGLGLVKGTVV